MEGTNRGVHPTSVVLADDDSRFRSIVRSLLESDGYAVLAEAGNASETVEATVRHEPDVVVIDLVLEGAYGLDTVQELVDLDAQRPVIVISSLFDPLIERETVRMGAWYLEKVEGVEALEHAIDQAVAVTHRDG